MNTTNNIEVIKDFVISCLEDKKASNIVTIDLSGKTTIAQYMIFATGTSLRNISAIADHLTLLLKNNMNISSNIEGLGSSDWVLVDLGDIIVHIFCQEKRNELKLEDKWSENLLI